MLRFNLPASPRAQERSCYFNTSYVTVQPTWETDIENIISDFNTSYVTVQPVQDLLGHADIRNFNTSYVTVQPNSLCNILRPNQISIHPMLRFNFLVVRVGTRLSEFQYILCYGSTGKSDFWYSFTLFISIHPMLRFNDVIKGFSGQIKKFQYILCYGST